MAEKDNEITLHEVAFKILIGILTLLTFIFIFFVFKDYQSFKESSNYIPLFFKYYIVIALYILLNERLIEFADLLFFRKSYPKNIVKRPFGKRTNIFIFLSISIGIIAISFLFGDLLRLFSFAEINLKSVPKSQFLYSILISATTIFIIFSSVCLLFSELIFKNDESFERLGTIFIIAILGFGVHTYLQNSFYEGYSSYISNLTERMENYLAVFAIISLILLIFNFAFLLVRHKKNIEESKKLKQKLESNFVQRIDYANKYTHITKFDKYGLALTRIEKEFDGKKDREFYGIINRFGEEILPNKYYFGPYEIPYYKNYPLIIVRELETKNQGVLDIHGNWIIEADNQSIDFPNQQNPSNDTWESHEKYLSITDSSLLTIDDMVLVIKDWESGIKEKTNNGFSTSYEGYFINKLYEKIKMIIVSVTIID